ncbi:MAG: protein phosphatase 2C domain-containing protein [Xenococcus sp. MO_188.B8]|nr:protein phosphatase 2C domain-containing protein [Xenococcus sp. MO_188.B8]
MQIPFELAVGSVRGREHLRLERNNQDAYAILRNEQYTVAVVCDGCGSGQYSEVGAQIGARLTIESLTRALSSQSSKGNPISSDRLLEQVRQDLLRQIDNLAQAMGGNWLQTLKDYFLFTIVGVVITSTDILVFSLGDGVIIINGKEIDLGSFPGNAPPYLAYELSAIAPNHRLRSHSLPPLEQVESILIGTDGVRELINVAQQQLPGKQELVGSISQFWQEDRYFTNPDQIRRRLSLINREVTKFDRQTQKLQKTLGLLPDDTSLVVLRRSNLKQKNQAINNECLC